MDVQERTQAFPVWKKEERIEICSRDNMGKQKKNAFRIQESHTYKWGFFLEFSAQIGNNLSIVKEKSLHCWQNFHNLITTIRFS